MSGFNVEDLAIDLFYWFDKSTKRKALLSEYCNFCDVQYRDIIKHVNTRWFSLEKAVYRVLQQYDALKSYFISQGMLLEYTIINNHNETRYVFILNVTCGCIYSRRLKKRLRT